MIDQIEIAHLFNRVYKGQPNFLTPKILEYGRSGRYVYELSTGKFMSEARLYGVTVLDTEGNKMHDLNKCFHDLDEAREYIRKLSTIKEAENV